MMRNNIERYKDEKNCIHYIYYGNIIMLLQ
jgi:SepF-like predicted cell division protein (DUF552 family)